MTGRLFFYGAQGLWAVSSGDGKLIWGLATDGLQLPCLADSAFRSAQTVEDVNGDKVPDLVVAIKGRRKEGQTARQGSVPSNFVSFCLFVPLY